MIFWGLRQEVRNINRYMLITGANIDKRRGETLGIIIWNVLSEKVKFVPSIDMVVANLNRNGYRCTSTTSVSPSTCCLAGCSVGDCTSLRISLWGVKVGNPSSVSIGNVTKSDTYLRFQVEKTITQGLI